MNKSQIQGPYEVQIVNDAGQPLPFMNFHGKPCVRSQCGMTYNIKVIVHRNVAGAFPASHLIICAKVDGRSVGYSNRLSLNSAIYKGESQASAIFEGFRDTKDDVCAFIFNLVESISSTQSGRVEQKEAGSITITIFAATPTTETYTPTPVKDPSLRVAMDDDKKFWQSPSAVTVVGEKKKKFYCDVTRWDILGGKPLAEQTLYYHTPEMFDFLKNFQTRLPSGGSLPRPLPPVLVLPGGSILVDLTAEEEDAPAKTVSAPPETLAPVTPVPQPRTPLRSGRKGWSWYLKKPGPRSTLLAAAFASSSGSSNNGTLGSGSGIMASACDNGGIGGDAGSSSAGTVLIGFPPRTPTKTSSYLAGNSCSDTVVKTPDSKKRPFDALLFN